VARPAARPPAKKVAVQPAPLRPKTAPLAKPAVTVKATALPKAVALRPEPTPKPRARPAPLRPEQFVWAYPDQPPYEDQATALRTAPAVDAAGTIYLHVGGRLVALVEEAGRPRVVWEYVTGSHVPGPIVTAPDGTVRLHCSDGLLHCLTESGKQRWAPATVGGPLGWAAPVVDPAGNTWISAYDGGLIKVDPEGRIPAHRFFRCRQRLDSAGIVHQGVLYLGSDDGYVFAVDLSRHAGRNLWNHAAELGHTGWFINSSPALSADQILVVAAGDEHLYGFTLDGQAAWRVKMAGQLLGSPVIDRHGHLYVGVSQSTRGQKPRGLLVSVDGNSHKIRWEYAAAGPVESTPVIGDDDLLYFGDNAGVIHALDFRGSPQWTARVEAAVRSAGTIVAPQRLAFGLDDETLVVLRCSSAGLAGSGWPKIGRTLGQCGQATG
jgi:outer membrane protein assembly factor BamB